jgi:hypothetical protein
MNLYILTKIFPATETEYSEVFRTLTKDYWSIGYIVSSRNPHSSNNNDNLIIIITGEAVMQILCITLHVIWMP